MDAFSKYSSTDGMHTIDSPPYIQPMTYSRHALPIHDQEEKTGASVFCVFCIVLSADRVLIAALISYLACQAPPVSGLLRTYCLIAHYDLAKSLQCTS